MNKKPTPEDFTKDVDALVKKYDGRGYVVIVDGSDVVLVRSEGQSLDTAFCLYTHVNLILKRLEKEIIEQHEFYEENNNKTGTLQ